MFRLRFDAQDLRLDLPAPGWYQARVQDAHLRRSPSGNRMLQVLYAVSGVGAAYARLAEYFVLEGSTAAGLNRTRRRLAELFRAANFELRPDDDISPSELVGSALDVQLGHDQWNGQPRVVVLSHRRTEQGVRVGS